MPKYNAAGLSREGALRKIRDISYSRSGTAGFPWPDELKEQMADAVDGAISDAEFLARVNALAEPHHKAENRKLKDERAAQ